MGYRYRKSIKLGDGFRINLSKSGIGYSFGVKGARITKKANGGTRTTLSIPNTGLSYVSESSKEKTAYQPKRSGTNKYDSLMSLGERAYTDNDYIGCVKFCVECIYLFDKNTNSSLSDKAFLIAAKAYDKLEMYQCVIDVCDLAIAHNLKDGTKGGYEGRKNRAESKLKKASSSELDDHVEFNRLMKDMEEKYRNEKSTQYKQDDTNSDETFGCMVMFVTLLIIIILLWVFFSCAMSDEEDTSDYTKSTTRAITTTYTTTKTTNSNKTTTTTNEEITVFWAGGNAKVYHRNEWCSGMDNPKEMTLTKAEDKGLRACQKCYW